MATALQNDPVFETVAPLVLQLHPVLNMSDDQFFEFCQINRDVRIERTAQGELIIMSPACFESSDQNSEINLQLRLWTKRDGQGVACDSSGGFILPNGAVRSPDASWVSLVRLNRLTKQQRRKFLPLCPEFVLELLSPSDSLRIVQAKMQEYLENGAKLGLLLDPDHKRVYVYQPKKPVKLLENPKTVSCSAVLPGFKLKLTEIW